MAVPALREMIAGLVAEPTVSSVEPAWDQGNRGAIDLLVQWLEQLGLDCRLQPLPGQPGKANLIATLAPPGGPASGGLALCGHADTVPCEPQRWSSDPFTLTEREGRLHGLGTADMKAFLALAVEAVRDLPRERLQAPVTLVITADEESGMDGVRALAEAYPQGLGPAHAVVGEPTRNRPVHVHKGMMMEAVRITGHAGHSSDPRLGRNALEGMTRALNALLAWRDELAEHHRDTRFAVPYPTLNLGHIRGGDNPNRICGEAELHFDLRPLPGMAPAELTAELERRLRSALGAEAEHLALWDLFPGHPPMATPREAPVVQAAEAVSGAPAEAVAFATEAPYLARLGMDVVVLGPGEIEQAHQPDESVELAALEASLAQLRALIRRFCLA